MSCRVVYIERGKPVRWGPTVSRVKFRSITEASNARVISATMSVGELRVLSYQKRFGLDETTRTLSTA